MSVEPFSARLVKHGLELIRGETTTLQVNVGLLCNQTCRHCHLDAGPDMGDATMDRATVEEVMAFARRGRFQVVDITGGAPEMNPNLYDLIAEAVRIAPRVMLRSNLTALAGLGGEKSEELLDLCRSHRVILFASLPAANRSQTDAQRGEGVWAGSMETLKRLNALGYGRPGSGLEINLVSNPTGAFLPSSQAQIEKRFRGELQRKEGVVFNNLFTFANVPLGRFRRWLEESGNLEGYMRRLSQSFNSCTVAGLMCRTMVSVSWEGILFDCDFHLANGLFMGGRRTHVSEMSGPPRPGALIIPSDHCYACTAGTGFT